MLPVKSPCRSGITGLSSSHTCSYCSPFGRLSTDSLSESSEASPLAGVSPLPRPTVGRAPVRATRCALITLVAPRFSGWPLAALIGAAFRREPHSRCAHCTPFEAGPRVRRRSGSPIDDHSSLAPLLTCIDNELRRARAEGRAGLAADGGRARGRAGRAQDREALPRLAAADGRGHAARARPGEHARGDPLLPAPRGEGRDRRAQHHGRGRGRSRRGRGRGRRGVPARDDEDAARGERRQQLRRLVQVDAPRLVLPDAADRDAVRVPGDALRQLRRAALRPDPDRPRQPDAQGAPRRARDARLVARARARRAPAAPAHARFAASSRARVRRPTASRTISSRRFARRNWISRRRRRRSSSSCP